MPKVLTTLGVVALLSYSFSQPTTSASNLGDFPLIISAKEMPVVASYNHWTKQHPELLQGNGPIVVSIPALYLFSPTGKLIHFGSSPELNVAFIRDLPDNVSRQSKDAIEHVQPNLTELIQMVAELRPHESIILNAKRFTLVSLTIPTLPSSRLQEDAIRLRLQKRHGNLNVIEVQLHD